MPIWQGVLMIASQLQVTVREPVHGFLAKQEAECSSKVHCRGRSIGPWPKGVCEGLWLRRLLLELGLMDNKPIMLYCDNKAASLLLMHG